MHERRVVQSVLQKVGEIVYLLFRKSGLSLGRPIVETSARGLSLTLAGPGTATGCQRYFMDEYYHWRRKNNMDKKTYLSEIFGSL